MIDLTWLPWKKLIPMLTDNTPIDTIQSTMSPLYYDMYTIQNNDIQYTDMSTKSKHDYTTEFTKEKTDNTIPYALQYRIYELWQRFILLRDNKDIVEQKEIMDAYVLVCVAMYERLLMRRIDYVSYTRDKLMLSIE